MEIKIKKATLSGRSLNATYSRSTLTDMGEITDEFQIKGGGLVHEDLLNALAGLKIHYALLCDLKETVQLPEAEELNIESLDAEETAELLAPVFISGFSLSGNESSEGIVISGGKWLQGRGFSADAPKARRDGDYEHKDHLFEMLDRVLYEVNQYLFHDKFAFRQMELDFEAAAEEYSDTDEPAIIEDKPRRGRRKKEAAVIIIKEDQLAS